MKNEINNELMKLLKIFEDAYLQRDVNKIDTFMEELFDKEENIIVVGTSGGEWCVGYEEAKDIFMSDWQYWGDLRINSHEAAIIPLGNTALIYTTGTIKYSFYSNKDTYARYIGYIKEYFDGVSFNSRKPDKVKLTDINWKLCHLLNQRDGIERNYLWDLRISFVLIKKGTRWIIRQVQFSLPVVGYLPDERIDNISYDIESFKSETEKMKRYSINNTSVYKDEIQRFLQNFNKEYLNKEVDIDSVVSNYFALDNPLIINTDKTIYNVKNEIVKLVKSHRDYYDEFELDYDNCLADSNEDVVWLVTHGTMEKVISESKAFENTIEIIKGIFASTQDDKDKLFNIRRRIADTLKENARGEKYIWPFRFEAVLIKEKDNWVFKYLQFSLPFNYILEGKTEAASILDIVRMEAIK